MAPTDKLQILVELKNKLTEPLKQAQQSVQQFNTGARDGFKDTGNSIGQFNEKVAGTNSTVLDLTKRLVGLAAAFLSLHAIKEFGSGIINAASEVENLNTSLEVMYGDVGKARQAMELFDKTAAKVPFTLREIAQAGTIIQGFSKDIDLSQTLTPFLDMAARVKTQAPHLELREIASNFGKAMTSGIASAEGLRDYIRGPLNEYAKLKFAIDDITKESIPRQREVFMAMLNDVEGGFKGFTEKLAANWTGVMSMLGDLWFRFQTYIANSGAFDELKAKAEELRKELTAMAESGELQQWAAKVGRAFVTLIDITWKFFTVLGKLYGFIERNKELLKFVATLGAMFLAFKKLVTIAAAVKLALIAFTSQTVAATAATGAATISAGTLTGAMGVLATSVGAVTIAFAGLGAGIGIALTMYADWLDRDTDRKLKDATTRQGSVRMFRRQKEFRNEYASEYETLAKLNRGDMSLDDVPAEQLSRLSAAAQERTKFSKELDAARKSIPDRKEKVTLRDSYDRPFTKTVVTETGAEFVSHHAAMMPKTGISAKDAAPLADAIAARIKASGGMVPESMGTGAKRQWIGLDAPGGTADTSTNYATSEGLPLKKSSKPEANGPSLPGVYALAHVLNDQGVVNAFTAFDDDYAHTGTGHGDKRAMDIRLNSPGQSAEVKKYIETIARKAGAGVYVQDEYLNPSSNSSAPHMHVEFSTKEDAAKFESYVADGAAGLTDFKDQQWRSGQAKKAATAAERAAKDAERDQKDREKNLDKFGGKWKDLLTNLNKGVDKHQKGMAAWLDRKAELLMSPEDAARRQVRTQAQARYREDIDAGVISQHHAAEYRDKYIDIETKKIDDQERQKLAAQAQQKKQFNRGRRDIEMYGASEFDVQREQARRSMEDQTEIYGNLTSIHREYKLKLREIDQAETDWKKQQAGHWAQFNLAQLQAMINDERVAQEERYAIRAEIDRRIAEDTIGQQEAMRMGWQDTVAQFASDAEIMVSVGRSSAERLRQGFSDTFFGAMRRDVNSFGDLWRSVMDDIKSYYMRAISDMIAKKAMAGLTNGLMGGLFGGGGGGGAAAAGSSVAGAASGVFSAIGLMGFSQGGVAERPSIFGEAGPEAAVPLTAGRKIPVEIKNNAAQAPGGNQVSVTMHITTMDAGSFMDQYGTIIQGVSAATAAAVAPGAVATDIENGGGLRKYFTGQ